MTRIVYRVLRGGVVVAVAGTYGVDIAVEPPGVKGGFGFGSGVINRYGYGISGRSRIVFGFRIPVPTRKSIACPGGDAGSYYEFAGIGFGVYGYFCLVRQVGDGIAFRVGIVDYGVVCSR
jgi:hypothetical protein